MIKIFIAVLLAIVATTGYSQSNSFSMLKSNYEDLEDVHTFSLPRFFCKMISSMADDAEFKDAVKNIRSFELITIPNATFSAGHHTKEGFRKLLQKDNFESLATVKDHGDNVEIFRQHGNPNDRYLVWTDNSTDVTAIEVEGDIDVKKLMKQSKTLANQSK
jgi:hypothetical protein